MQEPKLTKMLSIISGKLSEKTVPYCLIGAFALGFYGLPRYTSDIDLMADKDYWQDISMIMKNAGYKCFQKTDSFAQFDSELNVFGRVDFMFVSTVAGKDILKRSVLLKDLHLGELQVIQPSDYIILKLMAIANNPERQPRDEADISEFLKLYNKNRVADIFEKLDMDRIKQFAEKFGQLQLIEKYIDNTINTKGNTFRI